MNSIIIATDTFEQINGVSTTYKNILNVTNKKVNLIHPGLFRWKSINAYPEIQICCEPIKAYKAIQKIKPTHIHIATEGPIGLVARIYCKLNKLPFTSAYHTKFPEYLNIYLKIPINFGYSLMKLFHKKSRAILVPSSSCLEDLQNKGFKNLVLWTRGVSSSLIKTVSKNTTQGKIKVLSVGRISKEKNLEALCELNKDFDITIIGDGPELKRLKKKYKSIKFPGYKFGTELANYYSQNDVFCFTSKTDTFGIVIIEALCNGLPVVGYNVTGPKDLIRCNIDGYLGDDLKENIYKSIKLSKKNIQEYSIKKWTWKKCEEILFKQLLD